MKPNNLCANPQANLNMPKSTKRMKLKPRTQLAMESRREGANIGDVPVTNATVIANMEAGMKQ